MRKFTLPVSTRALVALHMLYGFVALLFLWVSMYLFTWLPAGIHPPWWVLPLLGVCLVWTQVICWAIPRSPLWQIVAACAIFPALQWCLKLTANYLDTSVFITRFLGMRGLKVFPDDVPLGTGPVGIAIFSSCALAVGYLTAVIGVGRVRHGMGQRIFWRHVLSSAFDYVPRWQGFFLERRVHAQFCV